MMTSTSLEELDISYNNIGDGGIEMLSQRLTRSMTLKCLVIRFCNIGEGGASELAHALTINTSLEILWMNGNTIGHSGAAEIAAALCINNTLKELSLTGDITIDCAAASEIILAALYKNTALRNLDLPTELSDKESLTELEHLSINRSRSDDEPLCVSFW